MINSAQILTRRSRELLPTNLRVPILSLASFALAGVGATAQPAIPSPEQPVQSAAATQEVEKIKKQLVEVDTRIRAAEHKALQAEAVRKKRDNYDTTLRTAMVKEEPKVQSLLEKQDSLVSELTKSEELNKPAGQRSAEFQQRFQEFKKLSEVLSPIAQRTSEKPEVAETHKAFRTALTSEMEKIEPAVPQLIEQRGELINKYKQLVQSER